MTMTRLFTVRFSYKSKGLHRHSASCGVVTTSLEHAVTLTKERHSDKVELNIFDVNHNGSVDVIDQNLKVGDQ